MSFAAEVKFVLKEREKNESMAASFRGQTLLQIAFYAWGPLRAVEDAKRICEVDQTFRFVLQFALLFFYRCNPYCSIVSSFLVNKTVKKLPTFLFSVLNPDFAALSVQQCLFA
jgi:hypothetical protein